MLRVHGTVVADRVIAGQVMVTFDADTPGSDVEPRYAERRDLHADCVSLQEAEGYAMENTKIRKLGRRMNGLCPREPVSSGASFQYDAKDAGQVYHGSYSHSAG